jgi:hypothetical protein
MTFITTGNQFVGVTLKAFERYVGTGAKLFGVVIQVLGTAMGGVEQYVTFFSQQGLYRSIQHVRNQTFFVLRHQRIGKIHHAEIVAAKANSVFFRQDKIFGKCAFTRSRSAD